ncbi:MAG: group II intron maturase-specific domain-containing protein, partial [Clostridia bacterium]|nr:group II intron maturase-specific domain-containing protein [Clostridia bacterium]
NSLMRAKEWIKQQRHLPIDELMERLRQKLRGYYQYYAITDNYYMVDRIREAIQKLVFKWLNRRSHSRSFNWEQYTRFIRNNPLPRPKTKVNIYELRPDIGYIM